MKLISRYDLFTTIKHKYPYILSERVRSGYYYIEASFIINIGGINYEIIFNHDTFTHSTQYSMEDIREELDRINKQYLKTHKLFACLPNKYKHLNSF